MLKGKALMRIGHEKCEVGPGDLIYIPPNAVHSISPLGNEPVRALAFAASFLFLPALLPVGVVHQETCSMNLPNAPKWAAITSRILDL
ncbi:cupin domain-containing protein [Rhizobium leguminosarum]|uniref:cupin domain-containing protein n=1 Tax=Rhizobium leguminosarum TaxID=384 RepID=UPI001C943FD7|nr:cupin domain-containing protein [Rhizobium leguminosarum]